MRSFRTSMLLALLALALALAACGGDSDDDDDATGGDGATTAAASDDNAADDASDTADDDADDGASDADDDDADDGASSGGSSTPPPASITSATGTFEALGGSGVGGDVTLAKEGGRTSLLATVTGLPQPVHALYITQGGCGEGGRIGPLTPLEADADGAATSTTLMVTPLPSIVGSHLAIYESDAGSGAVIACAEIVAG